MTISSDILSYYFHSFLTDSLARSAENVFLSEGIAPPRWFQRAANKLHEVAQDF
jgi:hypothetical protein